MSLEAKPQDIQEGGPDEVCCSPSYNPKACCGCHCFALGLEVDQPCWGDVDVAAEEECGDGDYYWVHECQGHRDCYDGSREYQPESIAGV